MGCRQCLRRRCVEGWDVVTGSHRLGAHQFGRARTKVGLEGLKLSEDWPAHGAFKSHDNRNHGTATSTVAQVCSI